MRGRNLAAFLAGAQLLGCLPAGLRLPDEAAPGTPVLEIDRSLPAAVAGPLAEAALDAGVAVAVGRTGRRGFAHRFRAVRGGLPEDGGDGVVIFWPAPSLRCVRPCLLLSGGAPASRQEGVTWALSFPGLESGRSLSADDRHALFEAVALWLRARSREPRWHGR